MALLQVIATNGFSCSDASHLGLVSWPVSCETLPAGCFLVAGQYRERNQLRGKGGSA